MAFCVILSIVMFMESEPSGSVTDSITMPAESGPEIDHHDLSDMCTSTFSENVTVIDMSSRIFADVMAGGTVSSTITILKICFAR